MRDTSWGLDAAQPCLSHLCDEVACPLLQRVRFLAAQGWKLHRINLHSTGAAAL